MTKYKWQAGRVWRHDAANLWNAVKYDPRLQRCVECTGTPTHDEKTAQRHAAALNALDERYHTSILGGMDDAHAALANYVELHGAKNPELAMRAIGAMQQADNVDRDDTLAVTQAKFRLDRALLCWNMGAVDALAAAIRQPTNGSDK